MSSYTAKAVNKKSGEVYPVDCLDDYFGRHKYGYRVLGVEGTLTQEQFDKEWIESQTNE